MSERSDVGIRPVSEPRRRDAVRSRQDLLDAATVLFSERGFDRTTVREIGERAAVDPALIARYFGGKAALYIETLHAETDAGVPDILQPGRIEEVLDKVRRAGPAPLLQAVVRPHEDPAVQEAARAMIAARLTDPLAQRLTATQLPMARLRAELAVAALAGIALSRGSGVFDDLEKTPDADMVKLTIEMLSALLQN